MRATKTPLDGCVLLESKVFIDDRGQFVKNFHGPSFRKLGLEIDWHELFWSSSRKGVVRGLHFQHPPADHAKLVTCVSGAVFDVAVDLRRNSPSFGKHTAVELGADLGQSLYVPRGMAHGFLSLRDRSIVCYATGSPHDPERDTGVHWDSCGIKWPSVDGAPLLVSARDEAFPALADLDSPF